MANYPTIYKGAPYKFEYSNGSIEDPYLPEGSKGSGNLSSSIYRTKTANIGLATDVRTADQIHEVSNKLSTGAKTIEVSAIQPNILEAIPKQHFQELARLKKLVGADLTFHGPLIEPTGVTQNGWDEATRQQAERQLSEAVLRNHQLNTDGNTVVTLHSSNGLPSPSIRMKTPGEKTDDTLNVAVIDERSGRLGYLPKGMTEADYFTDKKKPTRPEEFAESINNLNKEGWNQELNNLVLGTQKGRQAIRDAVESITQAGGKYEDISKLYKVYRDDKKEYNEQIDKIGKDPLLSKIKPLINNKMEEMNYGEVFVRDSYEKLKDMYNKAYDAARKSNDSETLNKLEEYKKAAAKKLEKYDGDPVNIAEFSDEVSNGISILSGLHKGGNVPQIFRPLREFAIEKASETFGNVAFNAFKQFGDTAPIISIENPPVGSGLSRADELRDLVKATQEHFKRRVLEDNKLKLSEKEAEEQAKKLIGVTWDVGHINMIRKYGYDDNDLIEETKKVKDYVKHIHLSDNFGLEHTELPMGMGNVPLKEHLKELGDKAAKAKQIVETGDWYQHFKTAPFSETLHALGSPIYAMNMQSYWNQRGAGGTPYPGVPGYFSGYGYVPEVHFSNYGTGFSSLPVELGGQHGGRSRLGGAPIE